MVNKRIIKNFPDSTPQIVWTIDWMHYGMPNAFPRKAFLRKQKGINIRKEENKLFFKGFFTSKETYLERLVENYDLFEIKKGKEIYITTKDQRWYLALKKHNEKTTPDRKIVNLEYHGSWGLILTDKLTKEKSNKIEKPRIIYFHEPNEN